MCKHLLLFRLALLYDIVYLQSITEYLNKVIRAIKQVNYGVQQPLSCPFRVRDYGTVTEEQIIGFRFNYTH